MPFTSMKLTTFGRTIETKAKQGKGIHFTRVAIGDGLLGNGSMINRTALVHERLSMAVDAVLSTDSASQSAVIATLDNSQITEGFPYRELALFAKDPDTQQEGTYLYDNAGAECEFLDTRDNGVIIYERLKLLIRTEQTYNITFVASGNPLYITAAEVAGLTKIFDFAEKQTIAEEDVFGIGDSAAEGNPNRKVKWSAILAKILEKITPEAIGAAKVNHTHTAQDVSADPSGAAAAVQANLAAHAGNTTAHLTATERTAWNGKANTATLTCTVPVAWTASGGFFYQNVSVPGILAADNPVADILPSGSDNAANKLYVEAWGKVLHIITYDNLVQIWCEEAPTVGFNVQFKVVR